MRTTRINQKLTALLCAFAIFVTSVSFVFPFISVLADSSSENLVADSGFDNNLSTDPYSKVAWYNLWGSSIVGATSDYANSAGKTGDRCLQIPGWQGGAEILFQVEEGYSYELSFLWAPCAAGGSETKLDVYIGDRFGDNPTGLNFFYGGTIASQDYNYTSFKTNFVSDKTGTVSLRFNRNKHGVNTVRIDDVVIKKLKKLEQGTKKELIKDGKFDKAMGVNWINKGGSSIISATRDFAGSKKEGDACLKIPSKQVGAEQVIELEAGKTYKLELQIAPGASGGAKSKTNISLITASNRELLKESVSSYNYMYEKISYEFKSELDENATLAFDRSDCDLFTVHIDDVSIVETTPAGGDFLFNGDFEETAENSKDLDAFINDDNYGWLLLDNSTISSDKAALNNNSVLVNNDVYGRFAVEPKQVVGFHGKYLGEDGAKAKLTISADKEKETIIYETTLDGNGKWQDIYSQLETGDTTIVYVHLESVSGENYFDAFKMIKLVEVKLNATSGANATLDCEYTVPGATVTLNISDFINGFEVEAGYPTYSSSGVDTPLTKVSDTQYTFLMPDSKATVNIKFTAPIGTELLPDVGFESGKIDAEAKHHWNTMNGQVNIVSTFAYDGKYSAEASAFSYYSLLSNVYIEKGDTYLLSFIHLGAGSSSFDVTQEKIAGVFLYDGWENNYIEPLLTTDDEDWSRYAAVFTATKSGNMTVFMKNNISEPSYFDNISLKKVYPDNPDPDNWKGNYNPEKDPIVDTSNLIKDSGFEERKLYEDKNLGWTPWAGTYKTSLSFARQDWFVNSGESAMRVAAGTPTAATQIVKVKPFTSYELTFYAISDTDGAGISIGSSASNTADIYSYKGVKAAEGYVKYTTVFKTTGVTDIHFSLSNDTRSAVYFDDVTLCELDDSIKGDLGFRKTASFTTSITDNSITLKWSSVKSKLYHNEDLTYRIYCSENKITQDNIAPLTPVVTQNGKLQRKFVIENLKEYTDYYIIVEAEDKLGNKAYLLSDVLKTNIKPGKQIMNGGFETGDLLYWYSLQPTKYNIYNGGSSGKYSLEMKDWCYLVYQPVEVEPNKEYVFSYDAAQATGKIKVYVLNNKSLSFSDALYENQIDEGFDYKKYIGTVKTKSDTQSVNVGFYNGAEYNYAYIDNVYFKKIENKDLYFFSEPQAYFTTEDSITVNWVPVHFADDAENITYEVFISEKEINSDNIGSLTPFRTLKGADKIYASAMELDTGKGYYFAVRAKDSLGNTTVEFSSSPFFTIDEDVEEDEDFEDDDSIIDEDFENDDSIINEGFENDENIIDDESEYTDITINNFDNNRFEDLNIKDDVIDKDEEIIADNLSNKKTSEKIITSTTVTPLWGRRIAGIIMIVLGCVFAATSILLIIKKKRKKGV